MMGTLFILQYSTLSVCIGRLLVGLISVMTSGAVDSGQYVSISPRSLSGGDSRARDVKASSDIWHKMHPSGRFTIPISTDSACWPRQRETSEVYMKARDDQTGKRDAACNRGTVDCTVKEESQDPEEKWKANILYFWRSLWQSECAERIGWTEKSRRIMKNGWWIFLKEWMKEWRKWWKYFKLKYQMKDRMKYFWREKRQREENASERRERK